MIRKATPCHKVHLEYVRGLDTLVSDSDGLLFLTSFPFFEGFFPARGRVVDQYFVNGHHENAHVCR